MNIRTIVLGVVIGLAGVGSAKELDRVVFLEAHPEIERVRMVCFDERTKSFYDAEIAALKENA